MTGDLIQPRFQIPYRAKEEKENNHPLSEWGRRQTAMCLTESFAYIIPHSGVGGNCTTRKHISIGMR